MIDLEFTFVAKLWVYTGPGAWHFVTLPKDIAEQIKLCRGQRYGFGTIRVTGRIGQTKWKTSLFPDTASNSFLLPIKAELRKKESLSVGEPTSITMAIDP